MLKNTYTYLWLLISAALAVILLIAFSDDIAIGSYTVKKAPFDKVFALNEQSVDSVEVARNDSLLKALEETKVDSLPQRFFIFGDSMTFNLALRLAQYAKQNGHEIHSVNWDSSNTKIWSENDSLANFIRRYKPTQIFISLGSNEVYLPKPEIRKPEIEKILSIIDTIPYVWIGPPNWNEDTGINDVIEACCKPGTFFRSAGMQFERKKDKIHPTKAASVLWMDSVMRWVGKSAHPFVADVPSDSIKKANPNIIFLKALNK